MGISFKETPKLFGIFHISALLLIGLFSILFFCFAKRKDEKDLYRILQKTGFLMLVMEVFKQWFCYIYVFERKLNLWFFPWQLCSMAMYCAFIVSFLPKEKQRNALLVFLSTYSLFADIIALVLPYDMLRDQIVLTVHSFIYHGLIIICALAALAILRNKKEVFFKPALNLFAIMALIAFFINLIAHAILNDIHIEPNMFYITMAYPTTQPVFHDIAIRYGIMTEIIIYLSIISLFSYLLFLIERHFFKEK